MPSLILDQDSSLKSEPRSQERQRPRKLRPRNLAIGATALALTIGAVVEANRIIGNPNPKKDAEITLLNKMRGGDKPAKLDNRVFVFKPGVHYRETPPLTVSQDPGNVVDTVKTGQALVAQKPLEYKDQRGDLWVGFRLSDTTSKKIENASQIVDKLVWVDTTALLAQTEVTHQVYFETLADKNSSNVEVNGRIDANGNIRVAETNEVAAQARLMDAADINFIERAVK